MLPAGSGKGNVLVSGQKQIEGNFLAQTAGNVFICGGEQFSGLRVPFYSSVIDADEDVSVHGGNSSYSALKRRDNGEAFQILWLFPTIDPVSYQPDKTDAQSVAEGMDSTGKNR